MLISSTPPLAGPGTARTTSPWLGQLGTENVPLNLDKALKRAIGIIIGRLRAYGARWRAWVNAGRYHRPPRAIPLRHQSKGVLTSDPYGEYTIHRELWQLADKLGLSM